jgi:hypothetical protein
VLVDAARLVSALGLAPGATVSDVEPLGPGPGSSERLTVRMADGSAATYLVRAMDGERAANHVAVLEALGAHRGTGFAACPELAAVLPGAAAIERWVDGVAALSVAPHPDHLDYAVDALAALHSLPVREGLHWDESPRSLLGLDDPQLYRLGFTAPERAAAAPALAEAADSLLETPFGFVHGAATAGNVLLTARGVTLVNFHEAGFGPQLFDLAAFLLTCGLAAPARRDLALRYAAKRDLARTETADLVDLAGLAWGLGTLLAIPRRLVEHLGDDVASAAVRLVASRVEEGVRLSAGDHPAAAAIRKALWPRSEV